MRHPNPLFLTRIYWLWRRQKRLKLSVQTASSCLTARTSTLRFRVRMLLFYWHDSHECWISNRRDKPLRYITQVSADRLDKQTNKQKNSRCWDFTHTLVLLYVVRLPDLGFFHFLRLYIPFIRFFMRSDIPFSPFFPHFFWNRTKFSATPGLREPEYPSFKLIFPPELRSDNEWSPISKKRKKRRRKGAPLKNYRREKDKIWGTLVRLQWRAAALGLKPLRLPRAHLPHPWVNKTKQRTLLHPMRMPGKPHRTPTC